MPLNPGKGFILKAHPEGFTLKDSSEGIATFIPLWAFIGLALACLALILSPGKAAGDIFRYQDTGGVAHFTDAPSNTSYELIYEEPKKAKEATQQPEETQPEKQPEEQPAQQLQLTPFGQLVVEVATRYQLDPSLVLAVIETESNYNAHAISRKGARGLMQLMPATAASLGVDNPFDIRDNVEAGVRHLAQLLSFFSGNLHLALAAYNAGKEAVLKYRNIPPFKETREYVRAVLEKFRYYQGWFPPK